MLCAEISGTSANPIYGLSPLYGGPVSAEYTVNQKTPNCFLIYSLQSLADCDKIWYILSRVNLSYSNVNDFCLT